MGAVRSEQWASDICDVDLIVQPKDNSFHGPLPTGFISSPSGVQYRLVSCQRISVLVQDPDERVCYLRSASQHYRCLPTMHGGLGHQTIHVVSTATSNSISSGILLAPFNAKRKVQIYKFCQINYCNNLKNEQQHQKGRLDGFSGGTKPLLTYGPDRVFELLLLG